MPTQIASLEKNGVFSGRSYWRISPVRILHLFDGLDLFLLLFLSHARYRVQFFFFFFC